MSPGGAPKCHQDMVSADILVQGFLIALVHSVDRHKFQLSLNES